MTTEVARDPICGRPVEIGLNTPMSLYRKRAYYFCSWECQTVFEAFAASHVASDEAAGAARGKSGSGESEPPLSADGDETRAKKRGPRRN